MKIVTVQERKQVFSMATRALVLNAADMVLMNNKQAARDNRAAIGSKRGEIMAEQRKGTSRRKASLETPKIIIDDLDLKKDLLEIGSKKGENMKETVKRLVNKELGKGV